MFEGVITALVTPFKHGAIDERALTELVERQIAGGVDGLVPCGTTGESPALTTEEHVRVVELTVKAAKRRVPVIAGASSNATHHAIELSKASKAAGADGLLHVTPYYNKPTQEGLYQHFRAVAEAAGLPIVLYNVPGRTSVDLLPDTVARLASVPGIVAIKEATGLIPRAQQLLARAPKLTVLSGDDVTTFALYAVGARGVISVASNVAPREMSEMWDLAAAGKWREAQALNARIQPLCEALFLESNPIPVKAALAIMGQVAPEWRLPLTPPSPAVEGKLRETLTALGLGK